MGLSSNRACVVIPALNAERTIAAVVAGARTHIATVIVIDDGSTDATASVAREAGATIVTHATNRGKGAALRTGLEWAREHGYEVVVTLGDRATVDKAFAGAGIHDVTIVDAK